MNQCQYVAMMTTSKLFFSLLAAVIFSAVVSFQPAPSLSLTSWPRFLSSRQRQLLLQPKPTILFIGTGLTFDDGDQILVSAQKPLGIVLEEKENGGEGGGVIVSELDPASACSRAGVEATDWLVAVNNADVSAGSIEEVMQRIIDGPKVVNLRFQRAWRERD